MKRIRNSVKAIIISLCLIIVLAGSIVGVVLANNKNGGKGGNNSSDGGNSGGQYEAPVGFLDSQKDLLDSISKLKTEIDTFEKKDYSMIESANIAPENVVSTTDCSIYYKIDYEKQIMLYSSDESGNYSYAEIQDVLEISDDSFEILDVNDSFVIYAYDSSSYIKNSFFNILTNGIE